MPPEKRAVVANACGSVVPARSIRAATTRIPS
jgi:hypothetical protein